MWINVAKGLVVCGIGSSCGWVPQLVKGKPRLALKLELNGVAGDAADFPKELVLQADADSIVGGGSGKGGKEASVVEWGLSLIHI